ncbi:dTDP-4-dehydrorhamnose reductase (plasmid) [Hoeflea sp. IMCC20628]|uniref:dTDP-4-dehydrorhamnose reductase n=1 Tax=Hoeflea sp. IMCC20628 TaxID=1620421 RepID=UPI00063AF7E5|nr:dTDP-4-dehydrorhamnose reductase [Hoeflea sp. IMCC20628]AKI03386.1 dTDP-4-dehydrorhamnose reductase [Hoeflea sp. IMCC20628]
MRILVTGTSGQIVTALKQRCEEIRDIELIAVGRPELELCQPQDIARTVARHVPDIVVSAAAFTAVDLAEDEPETVMRMNGDSAGEVALGAAMVGAPVIQLSTDYVYDGTKPFAWTEDDPVNPMSVYGKSKLAGERNVMAANPRHVILRTAWVYSPFGKNFVTTMLALARERAELNVVDDQYGCPTSAFNVADGILCAIERLYSPDASGDELWGIYNLAGTGTATWCDLAREIFWQSKKLGLPASNVISIATEDFPTKAIRPKNSRLDCSKFEKTFGFRCPRWTTSLEHSLEYIARYNYR